MKMTATMPKTTYGRGMPETCVVRRDDRTLPDSALPPNLASAERATRRRLPTTSPGSAWRPDPPAERHPRAELDALQADLVDQAAKQPQPPAVAAELIGGP